MAMHYQTLSGRTVKPIDGMKEYLRTQNLGEGESTMLSQKDIDREIKMTEPMISQCEEEINAIKRNPKAPSPQIPWMAA